MTEAVKEAIDEIYMRTPTAVREKYKGKSGIYGIYIKDKIVYVGKSVDLLKRFIEHEVNTLIEGANDFNGAKYKELRGAHSQGYKIRFEVLEYCPHKGLLEQREDYGIGKYRPALNTVVPYYGQRNIKHTTKKITPLLDIFN